MTKTAENTDVRTPMTVAEAVEAGLAALTKRVEKLEAKSKK